MTNPKMGVWGYQNVPDSRPEKTGRTGILKEPQHQQLKIAIQTEIPPFFFQTHKKNTCCWSYMSNLPCYIPSYFILPSGKGLHDYGKSPCSMGIYPLFRLGHFP